MFASLIFNRKDTKFTLSPQGIRFVNGFGTQMTQILRISIY